MTNVNPDDFIILGYCWIERRKGKDGLHMIFDQIERDRIEFCGWMSSQQLKSNIKRYEASE